MARGKFAVILPAAGKSSRFRDKEKKPFTNLDGRPVWLRSAEMFVTRDDVCQCIIVVATADQEVFRRRSGAHLAFMNVQVADGGAERFESVANALALVKPEADFVAIHDAVRPCVTEELIEAVFVKEVDAQRQVQSTVSRQGLWAAQTPQAFRREWLVNAYARRAELGKNITDDAQLVEAAGHKVHVVEGSVLNLKITARADLALAEAVLKSRPKPKPARPAHPFAEEEMWGGLGKK
jgi:2-C-methyl-D-erythritol 4-phosphate cytidylyltransferase